MWDVRMKTVATDFMGGLRMLEYIRCLIKNFRGLVVSACDMHELFSRYTSWVGCIKYAVHKLPAMFCASCTRVLCTTHGMYPMNHTVCILCVYPVWSSSILFILCGVMYWEGGGYFHSMIFAENTSPTYVLPAGISLP